MNDYITTMPREQQDRAGKIRTYSGKYVDPLALTADDIDIVDIAHHLSLICRYTGACPEHYSVAQHCVLVSRKFEDPSLALAGLLHDASEAYLDDLPSPVKHDPRMGWYREIEQQTMRLIFDKFGLTMHLLPLTKHADDRVFEAEVRTWWGVKGLGIVRPWHPGEAEEAFLTQFEWCQWRIREESERDL